MTGIVPKLHRFVPNCTVFVPFFLMALPRISSGKLLFDKAVGESQ
jgi:hypothetical protein